MARTGNQELRIRVNHGWLLIGGYHAEAAMTHACQRGDPWIDSDGRIHARAWEPSEQWDINIRPIGPVRFERDGDAAG